MIGLIKRYMNWLHTRWPAGLVEKLPLVNDDGSTNVPGLYIVGDLTGVPLLKFSSDTGARAVRTIAADAAFARRTLDPGVLDLVIIGGGVAGMAAAIEARKQGLRFEILEASEPFSTILNFPKAKPIFTYPTDMTPAGELQFTQRSDVKEGLIDELRDYMTANDIRPRIAKAECVRRVGGALEVVLAEGESVRAHRVIVAIGRSGNYRKLNVPGEDLDKVANRLHDPKDFAGRNVLVVGGGDSALEAAIALAEAGAAVTLSYRKNEFSRPKPENIERIAVRHGVGMGAIRLMMGSKVKAIRDTEVVITDSRGSDEDVPNDSVFTLIGREAPLDFFRRSGVRIRGEWHAMTAISFALFIAFCLWLYHWKSGKIPAFGIDPAALWRGIGGDDPTSLLYTIVDSASKRAFYYTLAYCALVIIFGIRRIRRRKTPYVKVQTWTLIAIQVIPLFLLPEIVLPWLGRNDALGWIGREFFPNGEYWRAYGLVLAWPLFVYNFFTDAPMWGWLIVGSIQTFVIVPLLIYRWGKGSYCGWICSCGALAETLGDTHRHKMPHGPVWNRVNMIGQFFLAAAVFLMLTRILGWMMPGSAFEGVHKALFQGIPILNYSWFVDLLFAGVIGVGFYFWFSGRVWCRFACPLAALMHIYARFSRFRILADKKKCISCNVCTTVCHQGIDVMNFANKGRPMEDPECVRCSACVQSCPTGVLSFGEIDRTTGGVLRTDRLAASPVQMTELTVNGRNLDNGILNRRIALAAAVILLILGGAIWAAMAGAGTATTAAAIVAASQPAASHPASQPAAAPAQDHAVFDAILKDNVHNERVDYRAIREKHLGDLKNYLDALAQVDHRNLAKNDRFAFYINVYNATIVYHVAQRYEKGYKVSNSDYGIFKEKLVRLNDGKYSLDDIEKDLTWNAFHDPRMHVAFVCGAVSCPPLLARAYRGDDLDEILDKNMTHFLVHDPQRNRIDVDKKTAKLSQLFDWYVKDFGGKDSVQAYVDRYHPGKIDGFAVSFMEYDWTLNDVPRKE